MNFNKLKIDSRTLIFNMLNELRLTLIYSETYVRWNAMGELVLFVIDRFPAYWIKRKKFGLDSDKTGKVRLLLFLAPLLSIMQHCTYILSCWKMGAFSIPVRSCWAYRFNDTNWRWLRKLTNLLPYFREGCRVAKAYLCKFLNRFRNICPNP